MDPNKVVELMFAAIEAGDHEELAEHAGVLADWLRRGGFAPDRVEDIAAELSDRGLHPELVELCVGSETLSHEVVMRKFEAVRRALLDYLPPDIARDRAGNLAAGLSFVDEDPLLAARQTLRDGHTGMQGHTVSEDVIQQVAQTWKSA